MKVLEKVTHTQAQNTEMFYRTRDIYSHDAPGFLGCVSVVGITHLPVTAIPSQLSTTNPVQFSLGATNNT